MWIANIPGLLVMTEMVPSKSEAKRLIAQGGVRVDGEKVPLGYEYLDVDDLLGQSIVLQVGKRKFMRVSIPTVGGESSSEGC